MSPTSLFLRYARRYTPWVVVALVAILVFATASAGLVSLIEPIFRDVLLAGEQSPAALGGLGSGEEPTGESQSKLPRWVQGLDVKELLDRAYVTLRGRFGIDDRQVVVFVPLLVVVLFLIRSLGDFLSGYSFQRIGLGITNDIRNDLYWHILNQSSLFYVRHPTGELVSRVVSDVALLQNAVSNRLLDLFQQSVTLLFLVLLLLSTHLKLALICIVAMPILVYPIVRFGQGMRRTSHRSQERLADLANLVSEGVRGHRVVKAFGMEEFEYQRFSHATRRHLRVSLWAQVLQHLSGPVVETLSVVGAAALLIYAGRAIRADELTAPLLVAFLVNLLWLYEPVRKLNKVNLILQQALAAAQRVARIMGVPNEIRERRGARSLQAVNQGITFQGVSFAYNEQPVLREVDLHIRRGEVVALVGPSGSGKTTLVNLLPRFFDPDAGRVLIDGYDIRDLSIKSLRSLIGVVTQEIILFNDTVRNNIAYGCSDLPLKRVKEAATAAYADEFIERLPQAYESAVGEAGLQLSAGERQRLAIARALLKDAPILILDEATSHLDSESESLIQRALSNLIRGRTTLIIAHRLTTVTHADRIVVMDGGRIVEQGSHEELLAHNGTYRRLYDLQFRD